MPSPDLPLLAWALWYAAIGIPIFPCFGLHLDRTCSCPKGGACGRDAGKHPLTEHGFKDATTNAVIIAAWWDRWPRANIGAATGHVSNVLDIDGMDLETWQQTTGFWPPSTWRARTGSGGEHLHLQPAPGLGNGVKRLPFADTRAAGGYVLLPPSGHRTGRRYEWIIPPGAVPLASWPADLLAALLPPARPAPSLAPRPAGIVTTVPASLTRWAERGAALGQQTHAAFWLACRLRQHGADEHEGWAILERFAAACVPPADLTKLARIWRDSSKYQGYEPGRELAQSLTLVHRGATLPSAAYRVGRPI